MKKILLFLFVLLAGMTALTACRAPEATATTVKTTPLSFTLTSPAFVSGGAIPSVYAYTSCGGSNTSPALNWGEPPAGTKSFALIMDDPDASHGTFVHWVVFNIPPGSRGLPAAIPAQVKLADGTQQGNNGIDEASYAGPCPPAGMHHYSFKLYALDATLDDAFGSSPEQRQKDIDAHSLAKAELIGTFQK